MTVSTRRCAHCFDKVRDDAPTVKGEWLCPTCANLLDPTTPYETASLPASGPPPALGDMGGVRERQAREAPAHLEQDALAVAERVCREVGVPLEGPEEEDTPPHPLLGGDGPLVQRLVADVRRWVDGRWWQTRLPVLLFLAWVWMRHTGDAEYQSIFKGLNLGIHELGHFVFAPFGDLMAALGGSLLQCLVPLIGVAMFIRQRDWFAVTFAFAWLGTSYFELAPYVGDAVKMQLPLVTPGGGHAIHDWNYILGDLGWLRHTESLAGAHVFVGHVCMVIGLGSMTWVLLEMFRSHARSHRRR